jgi:hypothetical protein
VSEDETETDRLQAETIIRAIVPLLRGLKPHVQAAVLAELLADRFVEWCKPVPGELSPNPEALLHYHTRLVRKLTGDEPPREDGPRLH